MVSSECLPFAKTGGLADAVAGLARELAARGHEVAVVLPKYGSIQADRFELEPFLAPLGVWMGTALEWCAVLTTRVAGVPFYFLELDRFFARPGLYHDTELREYEDNPQRYGLLARGALQLCRDIGFSPDVVHAHDWQAALSPAYLALWHREDPVLGRAGSVLTIHNIAHQGVYPASSFDYLGLGWQHFHPGAFEDHGRVNFLKGGLAFADVVNTVSPTYAQETLRPFGGHGLAPLLARLGDRYVGILNGVDTSEWDPATDPRIVAPFSAENLSGKAACKRALQKRLHLVEDPETPIVGVVSRLVDQKGIDVIAAAIEPIVEGMKVQFAVLGAGDKAFEHHLGALPVRLGGRVGAFIGFDEELAHWIEAGSDFFLMPSRFEPCGLNQIYSLRYGTLPIVRATGGLADTVRQYDEQTGEGTGFLLDHLDARSVHDTVGWAVSTWFDRPAHIARMRAAAMAEDFSWSRSAAEYERLYARALGRRRA
jgi:starch synthase